MPYRGAKLPVVQLSAVQASETTRDRLHLFVVSTGGGAVGIMVDRIIGQREIVVRAIADVLVRVDRISGATDLGDGQVVLILDPAVLARQCARGPIG
jgi:two-component system chemotaxis sensor kinase CheA